MIEIEKKMLSSSLLKHESQFYEHHKDLKEEEFRVKVIVDTQNNKMRVYEAESY